MATGFHGFHVIIGTIFLAVCLYRSIKGHFKPDHHFGFEAAAWYWHFVDVVWLFFCRYLYLGKLKIIEKKYHLVFFVFFFIILFCSLGTWQIYRLQWKLDLIIEN